MGKTGRKNKTYSPEFKISVIMDMREHNLSYSETMRKYFPHTESKNFHFLKKACREKVTAWITEPWKFFW